MIVTVPHHGTPGPNAERFAQALSASASKSIERLEQSPTMFDFAFSKALLHMAARCTIDPQAGSLETWEATVSAMQVGSAMFAAAGKVEGDVQCRIDHKIRTIPAMGRQTYTDAGNWLSAFWLAVVCRDQTRMTQLCEIPLDLLRSPDGQYDDYIYHWVDTLQTYWSQRPGLVDKLVAAIEASYPEVATIAPRDLLQSILYQPINLFHRFVRKDHEGFNQALLEALELHKQYWTADEDRAKDSEGCLALGPLAITCLAYDAGFPIEVESDYLPKHLLQRDWLGEFPT
ncbi:immunity 49 family protein [Streptomyces violaceusniger]|uniref:immunity 49 family protein n=1 Tax=Streptomyces violaceusniger TaxID=68280 RepID=UPI00381CDFD7